MEKKNKFKKFIYKFQHIFSLIVILLPFTFSLFQPEMTYADSLSRGKDVLATKSVRKALNKCGNIYNTGVPSNDVSSLYDKSRYSSDMQILLTYLILRNNFGSTDTKGYTSLWQTKDDTTSAVQQFNSDNIGMKLSGTYGNKEAIKLLSKYSSKDKQADKATQAKDAATDNETKKQDQDQNKLAPDAKKIADKLAPYAANAVALASKRNPGVAIGLGGTHSSGGHVNFNFKNGFYRHWGSTTMVAYYSPNPESGGKSGGYIYHNGNVSDYDDLITNNANVPNELKKNLSAAIETDLEKKTKSESPDKVVAYAKKLCVADEFSAALSGSSFKSGTTPESEDHEQNKKSFISFNNDASFTNFKVIPICTLKDVTSKNFQNSKNISMAKAYTQYLNTSVLGKNGIQIDSSANNHYNNTAAKWNKHFVSEIHKPCNITINKSDVENYKKIDSKEEKENNQNMGNSHVITWNWTAPYSAKWTQDNFKKDYSAKNGFMYFSGGRSQSCVPLTLSAIYNTGALEGMFQFDNKNILGGKHNAIDMCLNAKKENDLSGTPISQLNPKFSRDADTKLSKEYNKLISDNKSGDLKKSSVDTMGVDCYGDIVDGQEGPSVFIPYWQNVFVKEYSGFGGIKANPNLNDSTSQYFDYSNPAEFNVSQSDLKAIGYGKGPAAAIASNAKKYHGKSGKDYVSWVNKQVGSSGSSKLSDKACAALAVLITAKTHDQVKKFNSDMMSVSKNNNELYIGKSSTRTHDQTHHSKKGKGTYLYTATDIIQRAGLETDYGMGDMLKKTYMSGMVNIYNNTFLQSGQQDIFYTKTPSDLGISNLGLLPFYICLAVLGLSYMWLLIRQFILKDPKVKFGSYVGMVIKVVGMVIIMMLAPEVDNLILNYPGELAINKPLQEQSILDQWSNIRQEQSINNVLYSGLFGDTFGNINTSQSYILKFYTTTRTDGSVDKQQVPTDKQAQNQSNEDLLEKMANNQVAQLKGNGHVSLLAPIEYKTVDISSSDLLAWAIHMSRQIDTANKVKGVYNTDIAEKPDGNYKPGQCPLFVWLDKYYQPLGSDSSRVKGRKNTEYGTVVKGTGYGSGDSAYGKRRNPADTSLKSAYRSGYRQNDTNDNGDRYKGLSKYTEFAVNTQHFADAANKKYGTDTDSKNYANTEVTNNTTVDPDKKGTTMLTASQLFLRIFETTYSTKGVTTANETGKSAGTQGIENYNALMRFAQVLRGDMSNYVTTGASDNVQNQEADADKGQNTDTGDVNITNIGSVGRKDLIDECSMTKAQREELNGSVQFNNAARDVMKSFKINRPTTDWLGLDLQDSPLNVVHPYWGPKQTATRDGLIYKINRKFLNDYVNIYSNDRAEIQPDGADSEGNKNDGDEDSFSMAEAHIMALDEWFLINKYTHQTMFPQRYLPSSISLDTWNRMLLIPIGEMKNRDDDSEYHVKDKVNPSQIALQDNTAEFLSLRTGYIAMGLFILMQFALICFGECISLFVEIACPILLFIGLLRAFFTTSTKLKNVLYGSLGAKVMLGIMKIILIGSFSFFSAKLNNNYINGNTRLPVASTCLVIIFEILLFFHFLIKCYGPALLHNLTTFGNGDNGPFGVFKNAFGNIHGGSSMLHPLRAINRMRYRYRNWKSYKAIMSLSKGKGKDSNKKKQHKTIGEHVKNIATKAKNAVNERTSNLFKRAEVLGIKEKWNHRHDAKFFNKERENKELANELDNLENAKYGSIEETVANGHKREDIANANEGAILNQNSAGTNQVTLDLKPILTPGDINKLRNENKLLNKIIDSEGKMHLGKVRDDLLNTPEGRKELFKPVIDALGDSLIEITDTAEGKLLNTSPYRLRNTLRGQLLNDEIQFRLSSLENEEEVNHLLSDIDSMGLKLAHELDRDANNHIIDQNVTLVPKNAMTSKHLQNVFETDLQHSLGRLEHAPLVHDFAADVYNAEVAKEIARQIPHAKVDGTKVLIDKADYGKLSRILDDINSTRLHDVRLHKRLIKGFSDYTVNGYGHGINNNLIHKTRDNSYLTQIKSNNAKAAMSVLAGLQQAARTEQFAYNLSDKAAITQSAIQQELLHSMNNNRFKVVDAIQQAIHSNNLVLNKKASSALKYLNQQISNNGINSYNSLGENYKMEIGQKYDQLIDGLKDAGQWNAIQNNLSQRSSDIQLQRLSEQDNGLRSEMMKLMGPVGSSMSRISSDKLAEFISTSADIDAGNVNSNNHSVIDLYSHNGIRSASQKRLTKLISSI